MTPHCPRVVLRIVHAVLAISITAGCAGATGTPETGADEPWFFYDVDPSCTLDCQECPPTFADRYFCDPEGEVWFCDSSASACPDSPNTGWPRWTLVPAACDCVQEDGTLLDPAACEGAR